MTVIDTSMAKNVETFDVPNDIHVALVGHGIQLSRTPKMHMDEGSALGINYVYDMIDPEHFNPEPTLAEVLDKAERDGLRGLNVTHPYKQAVCQYLDELSEAAQAVNAVNTVVFKDGKRFGHNTDYWGFAEAFRQNLNTAPRDRVLLLGAGGAGGAVANALIDNGVAHLVIFDPLHDVATKLSDSINARIGQDKVSVCTDISEQMPIVDGVVNASAVGMASHPGSPVPDALLTADHWVADIVYFPLETELLTGARARGCQVMDGSGMAVFQAVRAFELFTGVKPDPKRMRETFASFTPPTVG